jgi:uncharacterized protein YchJ
MFATDDSPFMSSRIVAASMFCFCQQNVFFIAKTTPTQTTNARVSFQKCFLQVNFLQLEIFNLGTTNYLTASFTIESKKFKKRSGNSSHKLVEN